MMPSIPVALQLYTVREETARDFAGTVRQVAALGYDGVEFAGYGDLSPDEVRALLDETGLQPASTHVGLAALQDDAADTVAAAAAIGCRYVVLSGLPQELRNEQSLRDLAAQLNEAGRLCQARGIRFGYHNHDWELEQASGTRLLDILLDATDAQLVTLELDIYWAARAGVQPVDVIRQRAGRVPLIHVKDMASDSSYTEVGDGTLDITAICEAAAREGQAAWYIVEHDQPRNGGLASAQRSLENLRSLGFAGAR